MITPSVHAQNINYREVFSSLIDPEERMNDFVAEPLLLGGTSNDDYSSVDVFEEGE